MHAIPKEIQEKGEPVIELEIVPEIQKLEMVVKESSLEPATAGALLDSYRPLFAEVHGLLEEAAKAAPVTDGTQLIEMKKCRALRLRLACVRVNADKLREKMKAEGLRRNNAIQGVFNLLKFMVEPAEEKLLENEQFAERAEAARRVELVRVRSELLMPYASPMFYQLADMPEDQFKILLESSRAALEAKIAAQKKAEEDRIAKEKADAEERERVRLENERLRKEAVARDKILADERAKAKAEKEKAEKLAKAAAEKAAAEREEVERKAMAEREKAAAALAESERKAKADRDAIEAKARDERHAADERASKARKALENDLKKLRDAEEAKKREAEKAEREAAAAPDRIKLRTLARDIRAIAMPEMKTREYQLLVGEANDKLVNLATWLVNNAPTL